MVETLILTFTQRILTRRQQKPEFTNFNGFRQRARVLNEEEMMRKFTQRVLISGAAEIAIIGAVGGVDLFGEAHADPNLCVNATTTSCQLQEMNKPQPRMTIICQPTGPKGGATCRQVVQHAA